MKVAATVKKRVPRATRLIPDEVFEKYRRACEHKGVGQTWNATDLVRELRKGR